MYEKLYKALAELPKDILEYFILMLMKDNKISFGDIAVLHAEHLKELLNLNTEELMKLRSKIIELWCGTKKELPSKLVKLIQEGKDNGWVNITQEKIENSKWNKPL